MLTMYQYHTDVHGRRYLESALGDVRVTLEVGDKHAFIDVRSPYFSSNTRLPVGLYGGEALDEEAERQFEAAAHLNNRINNRVAYLGLPYECVR